MLEKHKPFFQPGHKGYKPKGVPNKSTQTMKEFLRLFTEEKKDEIMEAFSQLEPKDKIAAWLKMVQFNTPIKTSHESLKIMEVPEEINALSPDQLRAMIRIQNGEQPIFELLPDARH